ncbi:TPA: helix-turn-helix domain-containing protein [Mannheimia haemolytica]|uniref:helix-turn-helix domain-containing protein n=1 Tax=Mannheimia haemolytica TaxID=75985 RepID=UPI000DA3378F|nr:helix-turn-helix transcriptional regulator [Mannheimia haemolytica]MCB4228099.1 helix-turn-helix domain-containing protein [Mannheimia haemolytica]MEE3732225.1 helix-turn-helix transcriptional regulator [Mannheimia haemolytica]SQE31384.1 Uncharacterized HTH-type transcriptional regulator HI_1476 [Mannheimia haemolytica]
MAKPNIYDQEFSKRMQNLISQHGGNVSAFAQKLEVSPPTVTRWIKGEADPSRTNLIKISEALDVSLEWLATGKGREKREFNIIKDTQPNYTSKLQTKDGEIVVNKAKLQEAIETLEEVLEITNKEMKPAGKAQMIWAFYELLTQDNSQKEKMIGLLKLVA